MTLRHRLYRRRRQFRRWRRQWYSCRAEPDSYDWSMVPVDLGGARANCTLRNGSLMTVHVLNNTNQPGRFEMRRVSTGALIETQFCTGGQILGWQVQMLDPWFLGGDVELRWTPGFGPPAGPFTPIEGATP